MKDLGMSVADAQLMAAQHAGEAAWTTLQNSSSADPTLYVNTYEQVYNTVYKLLLRIGPEDIPEWVTCLSNYFNENTIIEGIKDQRTDPLNQEVSGILMIRYTRPDNDWYDGGIETTTLELHDE